MSTGELEGLDLRFRRERGWAREIGETAEAARLICRRLSNMEGSPRSKAAGKGWLEAEEREACARGGAPTEYFCMGALDEVKGPNVLGGMEARAGATPRILADPRVGVGVWPIQLSRATPHWSINWWRAVVTERG